MLKLKKMLSGMISAVMLTAYVPVGSVQAEESFDVSNESYRLNSWTVNKVPNAYDKYFNYIENIVQPTEKYARTDNYAMYIDYNDEEAPETYVQLANKNIITLEAGKYTMELWAKGTVIGNSIHAGLYWNNYANLSQWSIGETDSDGWTRYYRDFELTENDLSERYFSIYIQAIANIVIDDVALYNQSDKINLLYDGGFEDSTKLDVAQNKYSLSNWAIQNNVDSSLYKRTFFAEATDRDSWGDSGHSLHVVFPTTRDYPNTYLRFYQSGLTITENTTYHLSFKAKGDFYFQGGFGWGAPSFNSNGVTPTELSDGWKQYDFDITPTSKADAFRIDFDRRIYNLYLDDIVITANGSPTNLLKNGDFETVTEIDNTSITDFNAEAADSGESVILSWTNPSNYYIENIDIYINNEIYSGVNVNTTSKAANEVVIGELKNGKNYEFKLIVTIDGEDYVYTDSVNLNVGGEKLFNVADEREAYKLNNSSWTIHYVPNTINKTYNYVQPTKKYARTDDYGMYISYVDSYADSTYILLQNPSTINLPAGTYVMEFWAKGEAVNDAIWGGIYWTAGSTRNDIKKWSIGETDNNGWTQYTYEFALASDITNKNFGFHIQRQSEMVIDDVVLYSKNTNTGALTATNYLADGSFENVSVYNSTKLINPVAYSIKNGGALSLSWTNPESTMISDIKVFVDGIEYKTLTIDNNKGAINEHVIENLINGKEYEIKIVPTIFGFEYPVVLKAIPNKNSGKYLLGDWIVEFNDNGTYYSNSDATLEDDGDNGCLRIVSNTNAAGIVDSADYKPNVYVRATQKITLDKNKKYKIVGKYKTEGIAYHLNIIEEGEDIGIYNRDILSWGNKKEYNEWTEFATDLDSSLYDPYSSETYDVYIRISSDIMAGTVMLDDIGVYEVDIFDDTALVGDNVLVNGGFEYDKYSISDTEFKLVEGEQKTPINNIQAGTIEVKTKIKNYKMGNAFNVAVAVVLYNNGKLENITTMERVIPQLSYGVPSDEFTTTVDVPASTGYEIKVLYWDGFGTMLPLDTADRLKTAE